MYVKHLSLTYFRNYTRQELDLPARVNILQGDNAQGKTNLLEAIYYLATTKSPLASSGRQLINWAADDEVIPHAHVQALFVRAGEERTLEITLVKERDTNGDTEKINFRRGIRLDGVPRRALDVVGTMNVVLFLPEDIALVSGSPGARRRYLDITLCQIDALYCRFLSRYNRVITQRNALLRRIREGQAAAAELDYWDEQQARLGAYVLSRRLWAIGELEKGADEIQRALTGEQERLALAYQSSISKHLLGQHKVSADEETSTASLRDAEDSSPLEELFRRTLQQVRSEEIARAVTIVGPHRDDLRFLVNGIDATIFGSRGQQRTVALALKLSEVELMHRQTGEMPILLLDDVISELDQRRGRFLIDTISRAQQVLITTTNLGYYTQEFLASAVLWQVVAGTVSPLE